MIIQIEELKHRQELEERKYTKEINQYKNEINILEEELERFKANKSERIDQIKSTENKLDFTQKTILELKREKQDLIGKLN